MNATALNADLQNIVVSEIYPHAPEVIWKVLSNGELMARWLMTPSGFTPVVGQQFTFQTTSAGKWDGTISCQVLEVVTNKHLAFSWKGGHEANEGYGSKLDTIVSFTLDSVEEGTRLSLVHSGFVLPKNTVAFEKMGHGWKIVAGKIAETAASTA